MLKEYAKKRHFDVTSEPGPETRPSTASDEPLRFVVQKHAATRLHYDFRIELDGAMTSWAVPKGPSLNPDDKRLAVRVEDHPLDYQYFEGFIPQGEYGGGEVLIWDRGIYHCPKAPLEREKQEAELRQEVERGKVEVVLEGEKLRGGFAFIRKEGKTWFLIKMRDEFISEQDVLKDDRSVVSGRRVGALAGATEDKPLPDLRPMLPTEAEHAFDNDEWSFEPKLDGVRVLAYLRPSGIRIITRNGNDATAKLPLLVRDLAPFADRNAILDGEIVVLDENGKPCFQTLMEGFQAGTARTAQLWAFDVLFLDGEDLRRNTWERRRKKLEDLGLKGRIRVVDSFPGAGTLLLEHAAEMGFEGIVGKRKDSRYEDGRRSKSWIKVKGHRSDEFLVGGYLVGKGARERSFGSLMLGRPVPGQELLEYMGNVGGGFDDHSLEQIRPELDKLVTNERPFSTDPGFKGATYLRPELIVEVQYGNITKEGRLRFPTFMRLRPDLTRADLEAKSQEAALPDSESDPFDFGNRRPDSSISGSKTESRESETGVRDSRIHNPQSTIHNPQSASGWYASTSGTRKYDPEDTGLRSHLIATALPNDPASVSRSADAFLAELAHAGKEARISIDGHLIHFTNLDKELWPGYTKRDLVTYYATVSETLLPYFIDRPLSFVRCPDGIEKHHFFQKHYDKGRPEFVKAVAIYSGHNEGVRDYVVCNNLATLVWLGQMAAVELNPWMSRITPDESLGVSTDFSSSKEALEDSVLNRADYLVFDLDPHFGGKATEWRQPEWELMAEVAVEIREVLATIGLKCFPKSSGKTGLHVYLPLERLYTYDQVRSAGFTLGQQVVNRLGKKVTLEYSTRKRPDAVFIDVNQNIRGKTLAGIYSPRAAPGAGVSMPLKWSELARVDPTQFTIKSAPDRLRKKGDLWRELLETNQKLF